MKKKMKYNKPQINYLPNNSSSQCNNGTLATGELRFSTQCVAGDEGADPLTDSTRHSE